MTSRQDSGYSCSAVTGKYPSTTLTPPPLLGRCADPGHTTTTTAITAVASLPPYMAEAMRVAGQDRRYSEAINQNMQVPERLAVGGGGPRWAGMQEEEAEYRRRWSEKPAASYNMHIPDRLTYTEAPDLSPRPLFTGSKTAQSNPLLLETCWENQGSRDGDHREHLHSPMRRSYSDQSFGRTPPETPTQLTHTATHLASPFNYPEAPARVRRAAEPSGPVSTAEVSRKRAMESWSQDDDGGAAVEFIVLRRQVLKMSRRLAGLERQNAERRNTEMLLFSLMLSACLLNGWLWVRR